MPCILTTADAFRTILEARAARDPRAAKPPSRRAS